MFLALLVPLGALANEDTSAAGENPLPKILRDWSKRREEVRLITYRISGTRTWPRGGFTKENPPPQRVSDWIDENPPLSKFSIETLPPDTNAPPAENPPRDVSGILNSTVTLDFKNNRCRVESERDDFNNVSGLLEHIRVNYVGSAGTNWAHILQGVPNPPSAPIPDFLVHRGDPSLMPQSCFEHGFYLPLFFASGVVPTKDQRVKVTDIAPEIDASAFKFVGYSTEQGRRCARLRVEYNKRYSFTADYWIDLERDSAIIKLAVGFGGTRLLEIDYAASNDTWLPTRWKMTETLGKRTRLTESVSVEEVVRLTDISGETFLLRPSAGMYVKENSYELDPKTKTFELPGWTRRTASYRVGADGSRFVLTNEVQGFPGWNR